MTESAVRLLPDPDSPTRPSVLPRSTEVETPSTACTTPSRAWKDTRMSRMSSRAATSVANAWVEERVRDVDDEVRDDDEERAEEHGALDRREIGVDDRVVGEATDARDVEDRLREDGAAQEEPEVQPGDRHDRRERGPEAVAEDHPPLGQPLRPSRADVVLTHDLDQVPAHHAGVESREGRGQDEPGQDQGGEPGSGVLRDRDIASGPAEEVDLADVGREQEEGDEAEPID